MYDTRNSTTTTTVGKTEIAIFICILFLIFVPPWSKILSPTPPQLEHQTEQKYPGSLEELQKKQVKLIHSFQGDEDAIIGSIESARKTSTTVEQSEDLDFLLEVALNPQLLKKIENLTRLLGMFNRLPDGKLKEKLRVILCEAFNGELDICGESPVVASENKEKEKESGVYSAKVPRTDPDASSRIAKKLEQKNFANLAAAMKGLLESLQALKKLKEDFEAGKVSAKKFKEDYQLLARKIRFEILHAYRKFLKEAFKGKLPQEIYGKGTKNFQPNWEKVFREWLKGQPNGDKLRQTLEEYDKLNKALREMDELVK